tara:strand:- start:3745 stop:3891 length:147 start_codon:yes stop_codon:yes gene_type:complete
MTSEIVFILFMSLLAPLFRFVSMASTIEPRRSGVTLKGAENFKPGRRP